jgi:hypothetical protein
VTRWGLAGVKASFCRVKVLYKFNDIGSLPGSSQRKPRAHYPSGDSASA